MKNERFFVYISAQSSNKENIIESEAHEKRLLLTSTKWKPCLKILDTSAVFLSQKKKSATKMNENDRYLKIVQVILIFDDGKYWKISCFIIVFVV